MHLKEDIYKKLKFSPKKWQSPKIMRFLSITLFWRFFHKSMYVFRNHHKIYLIPIKTYFEQKSLWTLLLCADLVIFIETVSCITTWGKCLFYFGLRILTAFHLCSLDSNIDPPYCIVYKLYIPGRVVSIFHIGHRHRGVRYPMEMRKHSH